MRQTRRFVAAMVLSACVTTIASTCPPALGSDLPTRTNMRSFTKGLPTDPNFFPIAVWLQQPQNAAAFKAIGINTFVGLSHPPTAAGLAQLESHGIYLVLEQTPEALAQMDSQVIRGWLHIDEPDNAQPDGKGGHGDCLFPKEIIRRYDEMRSRDATRPVYLGFGQGVANPYWIGRGVKCSAIAPAEYYKHASLGADIVAFDIYPVAEVRQAHVMGRLELVGRGVKNLKQWAPPGTPVWADIETTHIYNPTRRPMPNEIYSEVWIAIINGANGINYFVHEWKPSFQEDGVFRYRDSVAEIMRINKQIQKFAPLLNSPTIQDAANIQAPLEIAHMVKQDGSATYIFAANMENKVAKARVSISHPVKGRASVLGEGRMIELSEGAFEDEFRGYQVHIYQLHRN